MEWVIVIGDLMEAVGCLIKSLLGQIKNRDGDWLNYQPPPIRSIKISGLFIGFNFEAYDLYSCYSVTEDVFRYYFYLAKTAVLDMAYILVFL